MDLLRDPQGTSLPDALRLLAPRLVGPGRRCEAARRRLKRAGLDWATVTAPRGLDPLGAGVRQYCTLYRRIDDIVVPK